MKITQKELCVITVLTALSVSLQGRPFIVMYLQTTAQPLLRQSSLKNAKNALKKITKKSPGHVSKTMLKNTLRRNSIPRLDGFLATYGGYVDYSNNDGLISFPLHHAPASKLYLLITKKLDLVKIRGETIATAKVPESQKAAYYRFEKQQDKNEDYFWRISKASLPPNREPSPFALTILTKPSNIIVKEGDFLSLENTHIVLPDNTSVTGNDNAITVLLSSLNSLRYFEQIKTETNTSTEKAIQNMIINP